VWNITLRNIQFRRRQFLIAVMGTALVFGMALLVTGIREGFTTEAQRMLDGIGGDYWVVPKGATGPFTGLIPLSAKWAATLKDQPGVQQADPIVIFPGAVDRGKKVKTVNVIGYEPSGFGEPVPEVGRRATGPGEAVVDKKIGLQLGQRFRLTNHPFTVVGLVKNRTYFGGTPTAFVQLKDAQALAGNADLARAIVMKGRPRVAVAELRVMSRAEVKADLLRPLRNAEQSINNTRLLLWLVAAVIVGAVMYMSALERVRDFAVLKALGASSRVLVFGLAAEAIVVCLTSGALAVVVARLLRPTIPLPVTFAAGAYAALPVVAVVVGVLASLTGMRRAVRTDPAAAFAGA
jgi:putative ABC transport system permease protein